MSPFTRREALKAGAAAAVSPAVLSLLGSTAEAVDRYADGKLVDGEPPQPEKGSFTVAVLPDTQNYSERYPQTFKDQAIWIAENKQARSIAFVLHLGDVTATVSPRSALAAASTSF